MGIIGIGELQEQASRILQQVREKKATYIITDQGRPVALLVPLDTEQMEALIREAGKQAILEGWVVYARIAEEIRQAWPPGQFTQAVLDEVRR